MATQTVTRTLGRVVPRTPFRIGIALIVLMLLAGTALFNKNRIAGELRSGDTIKVRFASGATLVPYVSKVKIAFVPVGIVTGVKRADDGTAVVSVKIDKGTRDKLGSDPSAVIRPTTLLGGSYFVDLIPGGDHVSFHGTIPVSRTALPVELDEVARTLQPKALAGVQGSTAELDRALKAGSGSALDQLAADAPAALVPAAQVLRSAQGVNRFTDLTNLVDGLENTARVLTANDGQLDDIVSNLSRTTAVLSARAGDLSTALSRLPAALHSADAGLQALDGSLGRLRDTAEPIGPAVSKLSVLLTHTDPVLVRAKPVVAQLDRMLADLDPIVSGLVPASKGLTTVINDIGGPVLERINGPVKTTLLSPYHGSGMYQGTGSDKPLYQELAYMAADVDRASALADRNGNVIAFEPGLGPGTIGGLPISLERMFTILTDRMHLTPRNGGK